MSYFAGISKNFHRRIIFNCTTRSGYNCSSVAFVVYVMTKAVKYPNTCTTMCEMLVQRLKLWLFHLAKSVQPYYKSGRKYSFQLNAHASIN